MSAQNSIEAAGKALASGINNKDASSVANLYTAGASLLPPGSPRLDGRDAVHAYWQGAIDMGLADLALTTVEVEEFGDTATEVGTFTGTMPAKDGGRNAAAGKFIVLWKKDADGAWQLHRDIWNFDA